MALTGLLCFMYPGPVSQIAIGLLVAVLSKEVYTYSRPYQEDADNNLANVGNTQTILVFIAALMLFVQGMAEQDGAPGDLFKGPAFAACMFLIGALVLFATVYAIVVETLEFDPSEVMRGGGNDPPARGERPPSPTSPQSPTAWSSNPLWARA